MIQQLHLYTGFFWIHGFDSKTFCLDNLDLLLVFRLLIDEKV